MAVKTETDRYSGQMTATALKRKWRERSTDAVQVGVGVFRHVVVEDDVDALDVHAATEQIGCHQDALLKVLELLVATESARTFRPTTIITARVMLTFQCRQDRCNGLVGLCCKPQPLVINRRLTGVSVKTEDAFVSAILSGHYIVDCWACCVRWSLNYYLRPP